MAISLFKIKKWTNMILGRSSYHVNQTEGKCYSVNQIKGYYNNLTEKITRFQVPGNEIPITHHDNGTVEYFSIAIFQYGLAAYDLWILNNDKSNLEKFKNCVDWAMENQENSGAWKTFDKQNSKHPYSAMAQGEGISLLVRAYVMYKNESYLHAAERAADFLLKDRTEGGVCEHLNSQLFLYEFTYLPIVLNGWIFAAWGLFDIYKITQKKIYEDSLICTINTIASNLSLFDCKYWSKYNLAGNISSPFYHKLHIAQLKVLYMITGNRVFFEYAARWEKQLSNKLYFGYAFLKKCIQKIME